MKFSSRFFIILILLLLSFGVLIQGLSNSRSLLQDLSRTARDIGQPALWRSAMFAQSKRFADYVLFLNKTIPPHGRVVLPPAGVIPKELGTTPYMQFFLVPRLVINCNSLECLDDLSPENTYILVVDEFPDPGWKISGQKRLMFDAGWGVIQPPNARPFQGELPAFRNLVQIFKAAFLPVLWLLCLTLAGFLLASLLLPGWSALARLPIGYSLGMSLLTFSVTLVALIGVPLQEATLLILSGLLFVIAAGLYVLRRKQVLTGKRERSSLSSTAESENQSLRQPLILNFWDGLKFDPWFLVFLAVAAIAIAISVGMGYHVSDEIMLWGVKGYGIAAAGSLGSVVDWGTNTLPYPLHVPVLIASFRLLFGEVLPAAKMAFSAYYLALVVLVYAYLRDYVRLRRSIASLATLLVATAPLVFRHGTIAYANLILSFYLLAAVLLLSGWFESGRTRSLNGWLLASGLAFASAAWTRPEGLVLAWSGMLLVVCIGYIKCKPRATWRNLAWLFSPLLLYTVFWYVLQASIYARLVSKSALAGVAFQQILSGNLHFSQALYVIQSILGALFDLRIWGFLGIGLVLVMIACAVPGAWRVASICLVGCGLLYLAATVAIYYLASYDSVHDIRWWVNTGLDRMLMPALLLLWVGGISRLKVFIVPRDKNS